MELAFGRERSELSSREKNYGGNSLEMTLGFTEACRSVACAMGLRPLGPPSVPFLHLSWGWRIWTHQQAPFSSGFWLGSANTESLRELRAG